MLRTSPLGEVLIELSDIDSTNNYAMRLINEGMAEHGITIRADFQSEGKGQHGNQWLAEESKNLLISVIIDTQAFELQHQFLLNAFACVSVAEFLLKQNGLHDIRVKWPNDIYAANRKIAGILIENNLRGSQWNYAIIGIGLNINQAHFPEMSRATSVFIEIGHLLKLNAALRELLKSLNTYFRKFESNPLSVLPLYNGHLLHASKEISFYKNHEMYRGIVREVDATGCILIEVDGKVRSYKHKEIELIAG